MPRRPVVSALLLACATLFALVPAAQAAGAGRALAKTQPTSFAEAVQRGSAWSVGVYMFVAGEEDPRVGAGFFVDDKGRIATAAHLLGESPQILVALPDKRLIAAEVEGQDETTDIALLRIDPPPPVRPVFARPGSLRVGDWVMAIGEPFGLEHSVSAGIVSGKDRHFGDDGELMFIQSDVALNPGNSGGPLLDATGAIAGMNARTIVGPAGTPGASLAIPIDIVLQIVGELRQDSRSPARPRLGAQFDDVPPLTAWTAGRRETTGVLILSVPRGSLAERLQLRAGDIVTTMNGRAIGGSADLVNALLAWRSVVDTRFVVLRGGKELVLALE
ncbi:MAG TPA: trypsin-like peptidase domain-containing protein [Roseateles sp.]|uniref:S1C family serine protease n=1 Tax=Roseateles sp. TaxID=1971397 RepID=UPI002EDB29C7